MRVYAEDHEILLVAPTLVPEGSTIEGVEISDELYDSYREALDRVREIQDRLREAGLR